MDANSGAPWSDADISDLKNELDHGRKVAETSSFLCRHEDEVRQKAKELGLLLRAASWRRLSHLFALLIVHAPRARGEVDQ